MAELRITGDGINFTLRCGDEELATFLVSIKSSFERQGGAWMHVDRQSVLWVPASSTVGADFDGDVPQMISDFTRLFPEPGQ